MEQPKGAGFSPAPLEVSRIWDQQAMLCQRLLFSSLLTTFFICTSPGWLRISSLNILDDAWYNGITRCWPESFSFAQLLKGNRTSSAAHSFSSCWSCIWACSTCIKLLNCKTYLSYCSSMCGKTQQDSGWFYLHYPASHQDEPTPIYPYLFLFKENNNNKNNFSSWVHFNMVWHR